MPSFIARPDGDEPRAAIIVLQEIFGVNTEVRRIAEMFAHAWAMSLSPLIIIIERILTSTSPIPRRDSQAGFAAAGERRAAQHCAPTSQPRSTYLERAALS